MKMGRVFLVTLTVLIATLVLPFAAGAKDAEKSTRSEAVRKKIALVLEGGGALGFAHVGVLEVLEKYNI